MNKEKLKIKKQLLAWRFFHLIAAIFALIGIGFSIWNEEWTRAIVDYFSLIANFYFWTKKEEEYEKKLRGN